MYMYFKDFEVMGKALPDELSCKWIGLVQACLFLEIKFALVFSFCDASSY